MKIRQSFPVKFLVMSLGLAAFGTAQSHAASITFGVPTTVTSNSDLDAPLSNGATAAGLLQAVNFGPAVTAASPLQSISFVGGGTNGGAPPAGGNNTVAYYSAGLETNGGLFDPTGTTVSGGFLTVMQSQAYASAQGNPQAVTVNGLTIGQKYVFQLFTSDDRGGSAGRQEYFSDAFAANAGNVSTTFLNSSSPYVLGFFTADATTQSFYLHGSGTNESSLMGYTLYAAVPEPSSYAMIAITGVALVWMRRRRQVAG